VLAGVEHWGRVMNCYKFATVKAGSVSSGFAFKLTDLGTEDVYSVSIAESSTLSLDLTYKDLCKISQGADPGKPWAIRGPYCDNYHRYIGSLAKGGFAGNPGDLGVYRSSGFPLPEYNICLFFEFNLWGECPYERFDGRLNAYGRKAKAEATPPDPENPQPCPTNAFFNLIGVPLGEIPDPENPVGWINIPFSISTGLYNYGSANNEPYETTGSLVIISFDEFGEPGGTPYEIKVTGTRNVQITEAWGE